MIKYLCSLLAKCFNAHLTDEEAEFKRQAEEVRKAVKAFNEAYSRLPSNYNPVTTFQQYGYGPPEISCSNKFRLTDFSASLVTKRIDG